MKTSNDSDELNAIGDTRLARENLRYANSGGISENNRDRGFVPAFLDTNSGRAYRSRFADGRPAPVHLLCGLPAKLFIGGTAGGQTEVKASVISGFLLERTFYTREAAAIALKQMH